MADSNAAQRSFWNDAPGQLWVTHQGDLDALHAGVTGLLMAEAAPQPGQSVLDIGCGAGATSLAIGAAVGAGGRVLGLDISEPLLTLAKDRAAAAGARNLSFALGDAQVWDAGGQAFDLVVSRFGTMFFADPGAAFAHIRRLLRPGGRLVMACWAGLADNPWFRIPMQAAVDRLGAAPPGDPDAPGPMALRDIGRVTGILRAAGFEGASGKAMPCDLHLAGGVEAAADLAQRVGPVSRHLRDMNGTAADREAIHAALRDRFAAYATADGIRVPASINIFTAHAPA